MYKCIRCNGELTGKQRKYCSKKCSRQKEVAKYRSSYEPITAERKQKIKDYVDGQIGLTHDEKQKLWYDLDSYRLLFNGRDDK